MATRQEDYKFLVNKYKDNRLKLQDSGATEPLLSQQQVFNTMADKYMMHKSDSGTADFLPAVETDDVPRGDAFNAGLTGILPQPTDATFTDPELYKGTAYSQVPDFMKSAYNQSLTGMAHNLISGEAPFDLTDYEPSVLEDVAATVISFSMPLDLATFAFGGAVGRGAVTLFNKVLVGKLVQAGTRREVAKRAVQLGARKAIPRIAAGAARSGTALGTYSGTATGMATKIETGEVDFTESIKSAIHGSALGIILGGVGGATAPLAKLGLAGRAGQIGAEIGAFTGGSAGLEGRLPNLDDLARATGIVIGLKISGAVTQPGKRAIAEALFKRTTSQGMTLDDAIQDLAKAEKELKELTGAEIKTEEKPQKVEKPEKPIIEETPDTQLKEIRELKPGDILNEAAALQDTYSPSELASLYGLDRGFLEYIVSGGRIGKEPPAPTAKPKAPTEVPIPEPAVALAEEKPAKADVGAVGAEKVAEKPKKEISDKPSMAEQSSGEIYKGEAWRTESGLMARGKTAREIVNFEDKELGNVDTRIEAENAAKKHGLNLEDIPSADIVWVSKDRKVADSYYEGGAEKVDIPEGSVILSYDGDGGYLVWKRPTVSKPPSKPTTIPKEEKPGIIEPEPVTSDKKVDISKPKPIVEAPKPAPPAPEDLGVSPLDRKSIGLSKAEIELIHKEFPEMQKLDKSKHQAMLQTAAEAKDANMVEMALTIAEDVLKTKRMVTGQEHVGMGMKYTELVNEYDANVKDVSSLVDRGDTGGAAIAKGIGNVILDQIHTLQQASTYGKAEVARTMNMFKSMFDRESMELAPVMDRAKTTKGAKLTEKESANFKNMVERHSALEKELEELRIDYEKRLAEKDQLMASEVTKRAKMFADVTRETKIKKRIDAKKRDIAKERKDIKDQIKALGFRVNDITGISTEGMYLVGRLAVNYMKEGVPNLKEVVKNVIEDVPDLVDRDIYQSIITRDPKLQKKAQKDVTKRVSQLKTQARLLVEIEKVENQIFNHPKKRPPAPVVIRQLKRKLANLRSEAYRSGTDPRRLEKAIQTINELQDMLDTGYRKMRKKQPIETPELATMQEKIKNIRRMMRTEDQLAHLNEQLRTGDFEVRQPRPVEKLPVELERKMVELKIARRNVQDAIRELGPITTRRVVGEIGNTLRTAAATADMSAVLRQGLMPVISEPSAAPVSFVRALKATFSEFTAEQIDHAFRSAPHHYLREKADLFLAELGSALNRREEMFSSNIMEKIPFVKHIVKASNRHMTTFLNSMRVAMFDSYLEKYPNATSVELKAWANWINVCSGRGKLGSFEGAVEYLGLAAFSVRFSVSRVQTPFMVFSNWKQSIPRVRKEIAKDLAKLGMVGMTTLALADWADLEVGVDPREADFGKIRIGNTRIDIWGGFLPSMRLLIRTAQGIPDRLNWTNKHLEKRDVDFDPVEAMIIFLQYKFSPLITLPRELIRGKTAVGEKTTPTETALRAFMPLVYRDIKEAYDEGGLGRAGLSTGLEFFGVGVNTYGDSEWVTRRKLKELKHEKRYREYNDLRRDWNAKNRKNRIVTIKTGR